MYEFVIIVLVQVPNGENKKDVNLDLDTEEDQEKTDDSSDGKNNPQQVSLSSSEWKLSKIF